MEINEGKYGYKADDFFKKLIESMNDIVAIFRFGGICRFASPAVEDILGYAVEEVVGHSVYEFLEQEDMRAVKKLYRPTKAGVLPEKRRVECRLRKKDGIFVWLQVETTRISDPDNGCTEFLTVARDITQQKEKELYQDLLKDYCHYFCKAVKTVGLIINEDGRVIDFISEYTAFPHIKGRCLHEFLVKSQADMILRKIKHAIHTGEMQHSIYKLTTPNGDYWVEGKSTPLEVQLNGKKLVASLILDVTGKERDRKKTELMYLFKQRTELFQAIITGSEEEFTKNSILSNIQELNFSEDYFCCIVHLEAGKRTHRNKNLFFSVVELLSSDPLLFIYNCHGDIGVFFRSKHFQETLQAGEWLRERILAYDANFKIKIGIGGVYNDIEGLKRSYRQAQSALVIACSEAEEAVISEFKNIGIYQLLERLLHDEDSSDFVERYLGPLIAYDREKDSQLLYTLEEILKSVHLKDVANKLYLHYNTVIVRKRRIEGILDVNLEQYEVRLTLSLALKLYRLNYRRQGSRK
ncbi:PAS domain S-box protein [Anaerosinus massiliensis]|uniref:PAS domain S-box protein n=1 Tax=Massilibacillus massiliensis TaxID=1806837 RepID=UPI000DA5F709|nr:PAS domain S-box protein [Massilibacillus massiliensis]